MAVDDDGVTHGVTGAQEMTANIQKVKRILIFNSDLGAHPGMDKEEILKLMLPGGGIHNVCTALVVEPGMAHKADMILGEINHFTAVGFQGNVTPVFLKQGIFLIFLHIHNIQQQLLMVAAQKYSMGKAALKFQQQLYHPAAIGATIYIVTQKDNLIPLCGLDCIK
jgi:hypothetical protein